MGSSVQFREILSAEADAQAGGVTFARFMELALFHPAAGYYTARRQRVGRDRRSDFYTAASLGPVFGELVAAAAAPIDDVRGSAAYRTHALGVLARRTLTWAWDEHRTGERACA